MPRVLDFEGRQKLGDLLLYFRSAKQVKNGTKTKTKPPLPYGLFSNNVNLLQIYHHSITTVQHSAVWLVEKSTFVSAQEWPKRQLRAFFLWQIRAFDRKIKITDPSQKHENFDQQSYPPSQQRWRWPQTYSRSIEFEFKLWDSRGVGKKVLKIRFCGMVEVLLVVLLENETTERKQSLQ